MSCALAAGASAAFGPYTPTATATPAVYTSGATFNLFNGGPGNVSLNFASLTGTTTLGGGGNISNTITTTAGATATVTYQYTAVPEPSAMALTLVGGLLGLLKVRSLRRKV